MHDPLKGAATMTDQDAGAMTEAEAEAAMASLGYQEQQILAGGKRCGLAWVPWMGDWFNSHSPRNSNSNAEGPWDHWVDLALAILGHPATAVVRPQAYEAVQGVPLAGFYDETGRNLSPVEVVALFDDRITSSEEVPDA